MGDRQDIDALLIGALYGELDGDDRARLDTHLASHPADRAALDELRRTRSWLHDQGAREALGAAGPSTAISARLIQEAARRAPAPRAAAGGGVFGFLAGLLRPVAAHPALSAAAALLIVIGAGSVMMRHKSLDVAQPPTPPPSTMAQTERATAPAPTGEGQGATATAAVGAGSSADGFAVSLDPAVGEHLEPRTDEAQRDSVAQVARGDAKKRTKPSATSAAGGAAGSTRAQGKGDVAFLEVDKAPRGADVQLRDLDGVDEAEDRAIASDRAPMTGVASGAAGGGAGGGGAGQKLAAPADAPAAVPQRSSDPTNLAWARDQHARMTKLVAAGRCSEVGQIGAEIARRAPDYYQSTVANDRSIRSCQQYVDQARRAKQPVKAKNSNVDTEAVAPDAK